MVESSFSELLTVSIEMSTNICWKGIMSVYIFDFDGVLAVPWTHPEMPYEKVVEFIKELHDSGKTLCLASYNPAAIQSLDRWGVRGLFTAMRAGSNHPWFGEYKNNHRIDMSKSLQIKNMLSNELFPAKEEDCIFFDDTLENIQLVNNELPKVQTLLIDPNRGLGQFC